MRAANSRTVPRFADAGVADDGDYAATAEEGRGGCHELREFRFPPDERFNVWADARTPQEGRAVALSNSYISTGSVAPLTTTGSTAASSVKPRVRRAVVAAMSAVPGLASCSSRRARCAAIPTASQSEASRPVGRITTSPSAMHCTAMVPLPWATRSRMSRAAR